MIYTVTFNPAIDFIVRMNEELSPGMTNRSASEEYYIGGKGINVSTILQNLGYDSTALGFIAGFQFQPHDAPIAVVIQEAAVLGPVWRFDHMVECTHGLRSAGAQVVHLKNGFVIVPIPGVGVLSKLHRKSFLFMLIASFFMLAPAHRSPSSDALRFSQSIYKQYKKRKAQLNRLCIWH